MVRPLLRPVIAPPRISGGRIIIRISPLAATRSTISWVDEDGFAGHHVPATELLPRPQEIELAGRPEYVATTFVGGLKHLPIRYRVTS